MAFLVATSVPANAERLPPVPTAASASALVSDQTRTAALAAGLDLRHVSTAPGIHIVPLEASPYTGELAERIRRDIKMQAVRGSYLSTEMPAQPTRASRSTGRSRLDRWLDRTYPSIEAARPHLRFEPASLAQTALSSVPVNEVYPSGKLHEGLWSGVTRSWSVAGLGDVQLSEAEHRESGTSITLIREWLNNEVAGVPATLKTERYVTGGAVVSLAWVTDTTSYKLELKPVDPSAIKTNEQWLLEVAHGLQP
jgi:hypothetical protein